MLPTTAGQKKKNVEKVTEIGIFIFFFFLNFI